ncbi:MAG: DUF4936 family protein [Burkholderiales bacterium]|nr:DUF4936 family protein [Burkholderiales bacterium]
MSEIYDYYVYYKVPAERTGDFVPVAVAMQSDVLRMTGVRGRLKKKSADDSTWMEVYEGVHGRLLFDAALADCVARFGMTAFLEAGDARHLEIFHDPLS